MKLAGRIVVFILGICLFLGGFILLLGFIANIGDGEESSISFPAEIILVICVGIIPMILAFFLGKWAFFGRKQKPLSGDELENVILKVAEKRNGSLTAVELAMDTTLSVTEAQNKLDDWANRGIITIKVTEGGAIVYHFAGVITNEERQTAKRVSEFE
ncbi:hypothetical protein F9U64_08070 [Gracilibacillus oryzae]|uniref:Uncharacterized protein n=1 Tax=Gracilibacillus oryzae TaxID=1672701 RepID=A0A7C8GTP4_9BACI|nr:hypothetical protein [Gracilibacillus oryzae]KAB8137753.1 hypothetical protein F9U64_08070 [Gracilibacillus oryzae]